jgi:hypothetical protein
MKRRTFLTNAIGSVGLLCVSPMRAFRTKHLIFIVSAGVRKCEYYEQPWLAPNITRVAHEGFVFEEDHCERVASHDAAFTELLQGREFVARAPRYPTVLDYIGNGVGLNCISDVPLIMERYKPRLVVCRETAHDIGHRSYESYLDAVRATDAAIGTVFDWVKRHPVLSGTTAIVIRPEFGRDDVVNEHGHLHHSYGFYSTHRVASIFWGPDFNRGIDKRTMITSLDMAPTLARLFNVRATYVEGRVIPGLFKTTAESTATIAPGST